MSAGRQLLFGIYVDALRMDDVLARCLRAINTRRRLLIGVLNAAKIVKLRRDPLLRDSVIECDLVVADGQSVVWASRLLGRPLPERVAGIDIFERLLALADEQSLSVALLGATPEVLAKVEDVIACRFPRATIAYSHHGFFKAAEADRVAGDIRRSGADMLFLGITSPKKEIFLATYGAELDVPILHGVGGSFDVMAGVVTRAPRLWQKIGMEWAFRLLQEPRRLAWRYLTTNTTFIRLTIGEMFHPSGALSLGISRTGKQIVARLA